MGAVLSGNRNKRIAIAFNMVVKGPESCTALFVNESVNDQQWKCKFKSAILDVRIDGDSAGEIGNGTFLELKSGVIRHKNSDAEFATAMSTAGVFLFKVLNSFLSSHLSMTLPSIPPQPLPLRANVIASNCRGPFVQSY